MIAMLFLLLGLQGKLTTPDTLLNSVTHGFNVTTEPSINMVGNIYLLASAKSSADTGIVTLTNNKTHQPQ